MARIRVLDTDVIKSVIKKVYNWVCLHCGEVSFEFEDSGYCTAAGLRHECEEYRE